MEPPPAPAAPLRALSLVFWTKLCGRLGKGTWKRVAVVLSKKGVFQITPEFIEGLENHTEAEQAKKFLEDIREFNNLTLDTFIEALFEAGQGDIAQEIQKDLFDKEVARHERATIFLLLEQSSENAFLKSITLQYPQERIEILSRISRGVYMIHSYALPPKLIPQLRKSIEENQFFEEGVIRATYSAGLVSTPTKKLLDDLCEGHQCYNLFGSLTQRPQTFVHRSELKTLIRMVLDANGAKVVAIQGMGGLGKTTFANELVRDARIREFEFPVFLHTLFVNVAVSSPAHRVHHLRQPLQPSKIFRGCRPARAFILHIVG